MNIHQSNYLSAITSPLILGEDAELDHEMILPGELRVRHLSFNDSGRFARSYWMERVFFFSENFEYSETETAFLSSVNSEYDCLIVGGMDAKRVARIARQNLPLLNRKLLIALMNGSNSHRRAFVISSGFDDAIDVDRISHQEGAARIRSMWARYQARFEIERQIAVNDAQLAEICQIDRLSERERRLIALLQESAGQNISYFNLQKAASKSHEIVTVQNLKVAICNLRKKLREGVAIRSVPSRGYKLMVRRAD